MKTLLWISLVALIGLRAGACINDTESLSGEKRSNPDMTKAIFSEPASPNPAPLRDRIKKLRAEPRENDAAWWNDLAGAHLRLGEAQEAATMLESITNRFANDYGIHANLGTAYHLLGRYTDAEKEIARDLEINPEGHSGLEKYHLALLQYLIRDPKYQARHVFVDEFSSSFLANRGSRFNVRKGVSAYAASDIAGLEQNYAALTNGPDREMGELILAEISELDKRPAYRLKWDLATNTNFEQGVIYMATLNPQQPACFVMLGIASWKNRDLNLSASAFEKAIALGSPQAEILQHKVTELRAITRARSRRGGPINVVLFLVLLILGAIAIFRLFRFILREVRAGNNPT